MVFDSLDSEMQRTIDRSFQRHQASHKYLVGLIKRKLYVHIIND